ncbi:iron uptake system protein EfeO [Lichenibacterium minor]|uniref:Iron uptake system protein EfeO n=1 Tax=Lichenibacterium minor TaxID=2316528 RepID=A0A4V1RUT0_9HYPH|nr:iron uptake system protein EfeO [Lichenibacterium minor]RYC32224.1 iron uptake system protein EfeO [Lichenibacterium minor]
MRTVALSVSLSALCAAGALSPARAADAAPIGVTISDKGCEPASVSVGPGKSVFKIKNESKRAVEWEILKGVDVVEERENIIPGFTQTLTATLDAGDYQMTCGLLSNPKGVLTVAAPAAAAAPEAPKAADAKPADAKPADEKAAKADAPKGPPLSPMDLVGPLAEYKVYVTRQVDAMVTATRAFTDAVKAGKLDDAKALYAPAHEHYERIEPIAELFNDLDGSMDSREDDFEKKAEDPGFLGFHRIEKGLFADKSTAGLAPTADKLMADCLDLQKRITDLTITPKSMVGGAADLIEEVASKKIAGEEDRYSRTDLVDFQANVDGAQKIVTLLVPLVQKRDPALVTRVKANFGKVDAVLGKYRTAHGFESYDKLVPEDRNKLKGPVTALAEDLSTLRGTLGID